MAISNQPALLFVAALAFGCKDKGNDNAPATATTAAATAAPAPTAAQPSPDAAPAGVVVEIDGEGARTGPGSRTDLSDTTVTRMLKSTYLATLRDCLAAADRVTIHFAVGKTGTRVMDPRPNACVTAAVEAWKFPVPLGTEHSEDGHTTPGEPAEAYFSVEVVARSTAPEPPPQRDPNLPPESARPPADATKLASGVFYKVVQAGPGGPKPTLENAVRVRYSSWSPAGQQLEMRSARQQYPMTSFRGLADGIAQMSVGDRAQIWVPERLRYDQTSEPDALVYFEIELVEILPK